MTKLEQKRLGDTLLDIADQLRGVTKMVELGNGAR